MISTQDTGTSPVPNTSTGGSTLLGLGLLGACGITFDQLLDVMDQWGQPSWASIHKRLYGDYRVYLDGVRVGQETNDRTAQLTLTATQLGRLACAVHVALQGAGQYAATTAVTRMVGYRLPAHALLTGVLINVVTHFALDRGATLELLSRLLGKAGYLTAVKVVRKPGGAADQHGAGTAWCELDRSAHRGIGWFATAVTVALALRWGGRR